MEWILQNPAIHDSFSGLGASTTDGYKVDEKCNDILETILHNILNEDKLERSFRRNISFGQYIRKDLLPALIHATDQKTIELIIKILVNLTIPVECLLSLEHTTNTDFGRHVVFELNNLLIESKRAFSDQRATKVVINFLKMNSVYAKPNQKKLSAKQCDNVNNCLLLLRNLVRISEDPAGLTHPAQTNAKSQIHAEQNRLLWNLFSQSIDGLLVNLITIPESRTWCVSMTQLIALLYKDQHVITLQKLLGAWLDASSSESSDDESNTSPPDRGSDSSPILTSEPTTSDSSDNGGNNKTNEVSMDTESNYNIFNQTDCAKVDEDNSNNDSGHMESADSSDQRDSKETKKSTTKSSTCTTENPPSPKSANAPNSDTQTNASDKTNNHNQNQKKTEISEPSDCGYGTQIENQGSLSTSSNDDDLPTQKPVHQKPHNPKQKTNTRTYHSPEDRRRKKLVKRAKKTITSINGISPENPTDEEVTKILKEFTIDFLIRGYSSLIHTLLSEILANPKLEIDTSHFFWMISYFLKFAVEMDLDFAHLEGVITYDLISYLTAEGAMLCEEYIIAVRTYDQSILGSSVRKLHLIVTAIREFVTNVTRFNKARHLTEEEEDKVKDLQMRMCETEELRLLFVLLLKHYNPKYHSKQYLEDLIVTNHQLLLFLDGIIRMPVYEGKCNMVHHIKNFAPEEMMHQYALLLECYGSNGEYVNDCVFTVMHHVAGDVRSIESLFQPLILNCFSAIGKSNFDLCDDWSDLIEYVVGSFMRKPLKQRQQWSNMPEHADSDGYEEIAAGPSYAIMNVASSMDMTDDESVVDKWTADELSNLKWHYMQSQTSPDVIGEIVQLCKDDGCIRTRMSIINQLYRQEFIDESQYGNYLQDEPAESRRDSSYDDTRRNDKIKQLCKQLIQDGKGLFLDWVQNFLLVTCFVKNCITKKDLEDRLLGSFDSQKKPTKITDFTNLLLSPVAFHCINWKQSIPMVPWTVEQAAVCKDPRFLQLLNQLGLHMPVDSGRAFIRIPEFWTADFLYQVAAKISDIDPSKLNFSINDLCEENVLPTSDCMDIDRMPVTTTVYETATVSSETITSNAICYRIQRYKQITAMIHSAPMPSPSIRIDGTAAKADAAIGPTWLQIIQKAKATTINTKITQSSSTSECSSHVAMTFVQSHKPIAIEDTVVSVEGLAAPFPHILMDTIDTAVFRRPFSPPNFGSVSEAASIASDLTRMCVSDEEELEQEAPELPPPSEPPRHRARKRSRRASTTFLGKKKKK